jgi:AcrR family transcriptional regulator
LGHTIVLVLANSALQQESTLGSSIKNSMGPKQLRSVVYSAIWRFMNDFSRKTGRPTKEAAEGISERILDSARETFCAQGVSTASMDDIARNAGMTKHTIYRRYPSKTALLNAVVERDLDELRERDFDPAGLPIEALKRSANHLFRFSMTPANARFAALLMAEATFTPEMRDRLVQWHGLAHRALLEGIERCQLAGDLMSDDAANLYDILVDLLDGGPSRLRLGATEPLSGLSEDAWFERRWHCFLRFAIL